MDGQQSIGQWLMAAHYPNPGRLLGVVNVVQRNVVLKTESGL